MDEFWEYGIGILLTIVFYVGPWLVKQFQSKPSLPVEDEGSAVAPEEQWQDYPEEDVPEEDYPGEDYPEEDYPEDLVEQADIYPVGSSVIPALTEARELPREDPFAEERALFRQRLIMIISAAGNISRDTRQQRATVHFAATIDDFVIRQARALEAEVVRSQGPVSPALHQAAGELDLVMAQLEIFIGQRRNPALLQMLGDADALALNCYWPALEFARSQGLDLSSAWPVTQVGGAYDLAIWTGFIPTGLAPIFLPAGFFENIMLWPAIAHEIGHDFLAATANVNSRLRQQLGLPPELLGVRPLNFSRGITLEELTRIFGGWFEEIFCDLFGTLMLGAAYGYSMAELFATPQNPAQIVLINGDETGYQYDVHPPRHLRLLICTQLLELVGQGDDAAQIRAFWSELHGGDPEVYLFPQGNKYMALPREPIEEIAAELVRRLYGEQIQAFAGFRLRDIPGMDYGPAEKARIKQVQEQLLAGQVPSVSSARAIIAGGVCASRIAPHRRQELMILVRRAIPAVGTAEHAPDAYGPANLPISWQGPAASGSAYLRHAFILHTILARPVIGRGGDLPWRRGLLQRRVG